MLLTPFVITLVPNLFGLTVRSKKKSKQSLVPNTIHTIITYKLKKSIYIVIEVKGNVYNNNNYIYL